VLAGLDLDVLPGTLALLIAANGAGKTTTLRIFATLLRPHSGTASVDGFDVIRDAAAVRRRVGVALVNERSRFWRLSALENLRLGARLRGLDRRAVRAEVEAAIDDLALAPFARREVSRLSAGQRQRVILARAGLGRPAALLADEPLRGLDEAGAETARRYLRARADAGAAVLVALPAADGAGAAADRVLHLRAGRLVPR
jgi:ABC-2 type transport system ATP-binding protein